MVKKLLLPLLFVLPVFAQAQGENTLYAILHSYGIPEPAVMQFIAAYAPGSSQPSPVSRLQSLMHGYVMADSTIGMVDSAIYSYSAGRGGDLKGHRIDFSRMTDYVSFGPVYEEALSQTFNRQGRVDTVLVTSRWGTDPFNNISRDIWRYSGSGRDSQQLFQQWASAAWHDWKRVSNQFDPAGRLMNRLTEYWNDNLSRWDSLERITNSYNTAGRLTDSLVETSVPGAGWTRDSRHSYTYDVAGNQMGRTTALREDTPGYYNNVRLSCYYDAGNIITAQVYETGRTVSGNAVFTKTDSLAIAPDPSNPRTQVFTTYRMLSGSWQPIDRISVLLSAAGNPLIKRYETWSGLNQWANNWQELYSYNSYDQLTRHILQSWKAGAWTVPAGSRENRYYYEPYQAQQVGQQALNAASLNLYPVPADNALTVSLILDASQYLSGTITDAGGRTVGSWNEHAAAGQYTRNLDIRGLSAGTYFLCIRSGAGSVGKAFTLQR